MRSNIILIRPRNSIMTYKSYKEIEMELTNEIIMKQIKSIFVIKRNHCIIFKDK